MKVWFMAVCTQIGRDEKIMNDVWKFSLKSHEDLKEKITPIIDGCKFDVQDNGKDHCLVTDHKDDNHPKPYFKDFYETLINDRFFDEVGDRYLSSDIRISHIWFQKYHKDGGHRWHTHASSNFSAVYFLHLSQEGDTTEFFDIIDRKPFRPSAKEGDIFVFPSHIPHRSRLIDTNRPKTIISFNMDVIEIDLEKIVS